MKCWGLLLLAEVARRMHFEYSTPKNITLAIPKSFDIEGATRLEEINTPKAPFRKPKLKPIGKNLASIPVALFASTN